MAPLLRITLRQFLLSNATFDLGHHNNNIRINHLLVLRVLCPQKVALTPFEPVPFSGVFRLPKCLFIAAEPVSTNSYYGIFCGRNFDLGQRRQLSGLDGTWCPWFCEKNIASFKNEKN